MTDQTKGFKKLMSLVVKVIKQKVWLLTSFCGLSHHSVQGFAFSGLTAN